MNPQDTDGLTPASGMVRQYAIEAQPYYRAVADEVALFEAAYAVRMPMMLKGPTGCGKTRFVEYMAWKSGCACTSSFFFSSGRTRRASVSG